MQSRRRPRFYRDARGALDRATQAVSCPLLVVVLAVLVAGHGCGGPSPQAPSELPGEAKPGAADGFETSLLGYMSRTYQGDQEQSLSSTRAALAKLGLTVVEESGGIFRRSFEVESEDGTGVSLEVAELTKDSTRITIKVGFLLGNADAARRIHSEIEAELAQRRGEAADKRKRWKGVSELVVRPEPSPEPTGGPASPGRTGRAGSEPSPAPVSRR